MYYGPILNSTAGIVFMGTPHQGSELVPWAMLVANIVNIAFVGQAVRTDLIAALKTGSSILTEISGSFAHRSTSFRIMSFIEMQIERPLSTLVSITRAFPIPTDEFAVLLCTIGCAGILSSNEPAE